MILVFGGFAIGCFWAGAVGCSMLVTRTYRKERNRIAIHSTQACVLVSLVASIVLLRDLIDYFSIPPRSSSYYAALYAYVSGLVCVILLVIKAEFRWRRSAGLISAAKNTSAVPDAPRKLIVPFVALVVLSVGFSIAFWVFRPKPISVIFGGISIVFVFAATIFPSRTVFDRAQIRELRTLILVVTAAMSCLFGAVAWKFHRTDPILSLAWLTDVGMLDVVALTAFFFVRPNAGTSPKS
jgi:hypothetical protein